MTVHFELMLACDLVNDVPQQVIDILKCLTGQADYQGELPKNLFFYQETGQEREGWRDIFNSEWYGPDFANFRGTGFRMFHLCRWDETIHKLTVRYEGETHSDFAEIYYPFLEWLAVYVDTSESNFVGYFNRFNAIKSRSENPVLIYFEEGKLYFAEVQGEKVEINAQTVWNFL